MKLDKNRLSVDYASSSKIQTLDKKKNRLASLPHDVTQTSHTNRQCNSAMSGYTSASFSSIYSGSFCTGDIWHLFYIIYNNYLYIFIIIFLGIVLF